MTAMYLSKSNFIFPYSAPTNGQESTMKKHMLKYIVITIYRGPNSLPLSNTGGHPGKGMGAHTAMLRSLCKPSRADKLL